MDRSTLIPITTATSFAFDEKDGLLLIASSNGDLYEWSAASQSIVATISLGSPLSSLALSQDDSFVLTGQANSTPVKAGYPNATSEVKLFHVDLASGAASDVNFTINNDQSGVVSVAVGALGEAFVSVPDLNSFFGFSAAAVGTVAFSVETSGLGYPFGGAYLTPSDAGKYILLAQGDISSGPLSIYDVQKQEIIASTELAKYNLFEYDNGAEAISESAKLVIDVVQTSVLVFDLGLNLVKNLSASIPIHPNGGGSMSDLLGGAAFTKDGAFLLLWDIGRQEILCFDTQSWEQVGAIGLPSSLGAQAGFSFPAQANMRVGDQGTLLFLSGPQGVEALDLLAHLPHVDRATAGADTFAFTSAADSPLGKPTAIVGFTHGQDKIDLTAVGAGQVALKYDGLGHTEVDFAADGQGGYQGVIHVFGNATGGDLLLAPGVNMTITGSQGDDTLVGGPGNDLIYGAPGNDVIDGGAGVDTAVFFSPMASNSVAVAADGTLTVSGPEGTDTLTHVEVLQFTDGAIYTGGAGLVQTLYEGLLGRAPSAGELAYWTGALKAGTASADTLGPALASSPDGQAHLPELIGGLYELDAGRPAAPGETAYWTQALQSGGASLFSLEQALAGVPGAAAQAAVSVEQLYHTFLGRDAAPAETAFWSEAVGSGSPSFAAAERVFAGLDIGGAHEAAAIADAYQDFLVRAPSGGEVTYWTGALASGMATTADLRETLAGLPDSATAMSAEVAALYQSDLGRAPTGDEVGYWRAQVTADTLNFTDLDDVLQSLSSGPGVHAVAGTPGTDHIPFAVGAGHLVITGFDPGMDAILLSGTTSGFDLLARAVETTTGDGQADVLITLDPADSLLFKHIALSSLSAADFIHG